MDPEGAPQPEKPFKIVKYDEESSTSVSEFVSQTQPIKEKRQKRKKQRIIFGIIALIILIGAGLYFALTRKNSTQRTIDSTQQANQQTEVEVREDTNVKTENFVSNELSLAFDYPSNWKIHDEPGDKQIMLDSPALKLRTPEGESKTGKIVMRIRGKGTKLDEIKTDSLTAARESVKLTYSKPSPSQRGQTYLAFLRFSNGLSGGVGGMYVMGDTGYKKDQYVPKADFTPLDPIISFSFHSCNTADSCTESGQNLSIAPSEWEDNPAFDKVKSILESLVVN